MAKHKQPKVEQVVGIYKYCGGSPINGGLNRMATPWVADYRPVVSAYAPKYKVFINEVGDGTAASRKPGTGLRPYDPMGYTGRKRGR